MIGVRAQNGFSLGLENSLPVYLLIASTVLQTLENGTQTIALKFVYFSTQPPIIMPKELPLCISKQFSFLTMGLQYRFRLHKCIDIEKDSMDQLSSFSSFVSYQSLLDKCMHVLHVGE